MTICLLLGAVLAPAATHAEGASAALAQPKPGAVLTLLEAPLRLIRGAVVYRAGAGVALQKDDILESGAGAAQVEAGPGAILALGPQTRILIASLPAEGRGSLDIMLLQGWLKVLDKDGRATVVTPALQVSFANGSTIVHVETGQDAVFAEEGEQQLTRTGKPDARGKGPFKLAAEQYAALEPGKPFAPGRPPRTFITAMPPGFRDRLAPVPDVPKAGKVQPNKEREADFADVEAWLQATLPVRKTFVVRFKPRLADPAFRKALDGALGQSVDWKPVLHPVRPNYQENLL
jgi:hypothetical protein